MSAFLSLAQLTPHKKQSFSLQYIIPITHCKTVQLYKFWVKCEKKRETKTKPEQHAKIKTWKKEMKETHVKSIHTRNVETPQ